MIGLPGSRTSAVLPDLTQVSAPLALTWPDRADADISETAQCASLADVPGSETPFHKLVSDLIQPHQVAFEITQHGPVFASLVSYLGGVSQVEEARRYIAEGYRGAYTSLADYAQQLIEDCYSELDSLPDFIRYHIDYEGIARDMELGGDVFTFECEGRVHVFDAYI